MIRTASTAALRYSSELFFFSADANRATRLAAQNTGSAGGRYDLPLRNLGNVYSLTEGYFGRAGTPL